MKLLHSRVMTFISLALALAIFVTLMAVTALNSDFSSKSDKRVVILDGEYSVNGSDWKPTDGSTMVEEDFDFLVLRGKPVNGTIISDALTVAADNMWFELSVDGEAVCNNFRADNGIYKDTPGYGVYSSAPIVGMNANSELEVLLIYPYSMMSSKRLNDFFVIYSGDQDTLYDYMFHHKMLPIMFSLLIIFFGLIAFPMAGFVLGKINYQYIAFGILCVFAGLTILSQNIYQFIPLWLKNPLRCLVVCNLNTYICLIAIFAYNKVCLNKRSSKIIGNIILAASVLLTVVAVIFHYTGVGDLYSTKPFMLIFAAVCAIIMAACMVTEIKTDRKTLMTFASLIPIIVCLVTDAINDFFPFTRLPVFETGMALTLINQIAALVIDMRIQYKESLRYEHMQKELYEAKVTLMVSQIQPHFLYNSLTSIAMMCTKDPKLAKKATINFADYLRGNMNSLKQTSPVPFIQELEHLKKYLMLEQMRFGDMLTVEYDIQTTDFEIPMLTVQPLVENAVKHGVGMKEDGGTVIIATRETDTAFEVIVTDDGVGFDTSAPIADDGRTHVGMENVRTRLREMCDADVIIESEIGKGTKATIRIPKDKEDDS